MSSCDSTSSSAGRRVIASLEIPADHPAYAGHFPGMPVLPGVVLLDAVLRAIGSLGRDAVPGPGAAAHPGSPLWQIAAAKFQTVVRPGDALTLEHTLQPNGSVRFTIRHGEQLVAQGTVHPLDGRGAAPGGSHGHQS
jgi:3-hydroxyacyl-[acyl-carrier-protein] dehydratase